MLDLNTIATIISAIIGPGSAAWLAVKHSVNGMREDVSEIKADVKEMKGEIVEVRERVAAVEAKTSK